jgi:uncharacterized protein YndB with AHSA1/START domain
MTDLVIHKEITIKQPTPPIWEALTNPMLSRKYFYNCDVLSDWKVGSPIIYQEVSGDKIINHVTGLIKKITPGVMFSYEFISERSQTTSTVTFQLLHTIYDETKVVVTQHCGTDQTMYNDSMQGWEYVLDGLKNLVERE